MYMLIICKYALTKYMYIYKWSVKRDRVGERERERVLCTITGMYMHMGTYQDLHYLEDCHHQQVARQDLYYLEHCHHLPCPDLDYGVPPLLFGCPLHSTLWPLGLAYRCRANWSER